jgi:hypothetical protein
MRPILLICAGVAVLLLPAATAAGASGQPKSEAGYLVVHKAAGDGGVAGRPVVTLVVKGFVLGRVSPKREAQIDVYHLPGHGSSQVAGGDKFVKGIRWRGLPGTRYKGSGFRFRAIGGYYRVVVRGAGVYLFASGLRSVELRGSAFDQSGDGTYSLDGGAPRSLPRRLIKLKLGRG